MGTLTLGDIRSQVKLALGNREDLDEHINSLINTCQMRLARFFDFEEMISLDDLTVAYTGVNLTDASISLLTYTRDVHSISIIDGTDYYEVDPIDRRTWKQDFFNHLNAINQKIDLIKEAVERLCETTSGCLQSTNCSKPIKTQKSN